MQAPRLDPRTWEELRRELIRRVPVHAPDWTDLSPADPGVALLELFAWLGERLLRRMDAVPAETESAFLRLLGMPRRAATPSRAWVVASLKGTAAAPVNLPSDGVSERARLRAGNVAFQIRGELCVLPVEPLVAVKRLSEGELPPELSAPASAIATDHLAGSDITDVTPVFYETYRLQEPRAGRLGEPVYLAGTADATLWIALLQPERLSRQMNPAALREAIRGRILSVFVAVDGALGDEPERAPAGGGRPQVPELSWQISTGAFVSERPEDRRVDRVRYERLHVESDGTDGLVRSGVVRLRLPDRIGDLAPWRLEDADGNALTGMGDLPPALDDEKLEERVLAWIRVFRPSGAPPVIRWAAINVVEVEQGVTQRAEILGQGNGQPGQRFALSKAPVIADSVALEIRDEEEPVGWVLWRAVADLASSRPDDTHYVLDPVTGQIRFGDGIQGRMPREGETVRVRSWRAGGGAAGNVPAGAISQIEGYSQIAVTNPLPATGGRDGETDAEARARAPRALRNQDRAVSPSDFRELALLTPGLTLGRAELLPLHKPDDPEVAVPGVLTLVVIPAWDAAHPDEPSPDREAARAVLDWLEPRRLVTTELYVRGPEYVPVWMSVAIELAEGFGPSTVHGWVEMALRQHFAPIPPYGPTGQGWPMGREILVDDVLAAALAVRGVRLVKKTLLLGPDGAATDRVALRAWQLPVIRGVAVATGERAPDPVLSPAPAVTGPLVSVPVVRERC